MITVKAIIMRLGGVTRAAQLLDLPLGTVASWQTRGAIPPKQWNGLLTLCRRRRIILTTQHLATLYTHNGDDK